MIQIPDYEILDEIGRGSSGQVFRCRQTRLDRLVAVKVLQEELRAEGELEERFRREARLLAQINHPNVVEVYDFGVVDERLYLVYELIDGYTLREHLQNRKRFEAIEAFGLCVQILGGLEAAHRAGVIHRDLKPENILLTLDGTLKITDFGTARALDLHRSLTRTGMVMGTPIYMSPEQCRGDRATTAADIYSVGVILYELLAGRPPFMDRDAASVLRKHLSSSVPSLTAIDSSIPRQVEDLVFRALEKSPARRFPSAQAFRQALEVATPLVEDWVNTARVETAAPTLELNRNDPGLTSSSARMRPLPTLALSDRRQLRQRQKRFLVAALLSGLITGIGATLLFTAWQSGLGTAAPPLRIIKGDGAAELRWQGTWPGGTPSVRYGSSPTDRDQIVQADEIEGVAVLKDLPVGTTVHFELRAPRGNASTKGDFVCPGPWTVLEPELQLTAKLEARLRITSSRPCRLELRQDLEAVPTKEGARPEHLVVLPLRPFTSSQVELTLLPEGTTAASTPKLRKLLTLPSAMEAAMDELPRLGQRAGWRESLERCVRRPSREVLADERSRLDGQGAHLKARSLLAALVPLAAQAQLERPDEILRLLEAVTTLRRLDQCFLQFSEKELIGVDRAFDRGGFQGLQTDFDTYGLQHGLVLLGRYDIPTQRQLFHPYDPYGGEMDDYLAIYDTISNMKENAEGWKRRLARTRLFDVDLPADFAAERWKGLVVAFQTQALLLRYEAQVKINEEDGGGSFRLYGQSRKAGDVSANFQLTGKASWVTSNLIPATWFHGGRNQLQLRLRCIDGEALQPTTFYRFRLLGLPVKTETQERVK